MSKILIVEDDENILELEKDYIEASNMEAQGATNGNDGLELALNNDYDLILMDVHLPGINGTEATSEIRKFDSHIPIVALTAISLNENREMLLSYGMNEVITKPFEPEHFYAVVSRYLTNN